MRIFTISFKYKTIFPASEVTLKDVEEFVKDRLRLFASPDVLSTLSVKEDKIIK